ncbi:hypothetical protein P43SY_009751 [Pythium insidiosum]|uniref:Transmembrane protein n=1 Tax=Pythium insidiosum TaxID=114742 RepID=A0AAD5M6Q5_PYTIN|nr:hypothetical protein P43SY_009751 [Pythium insidiosum]
MPFFTREDFKIGFNFFCVKAVALVVILFCGATGSYVTYLSGKALFANVAASPPFPFCPAEYQHIVYTNATHYGL